MISFASPQTVELSSPPLRNAAVSPSGAARAIEADPEVKAAAIRRVAAAHQGLSNALAVLIADACQPITDTLKESADETASLRAEVGRGEAKIADLERRLARTDRRTIRGVGSEKDKR